jgi:hypothetical protein
VLPDLRINAPRLEPDPVLLEQLSQLSRAAAPPRAPGHAARSLLSAATVLVVAGLSWLTGTLPGVASPFSPGHHPSPQHAPADPTPGSVSDDEDTIPVTPPIVPPGQVKPHQDNGNHTGQIKPHSNNGNHTGQIKPHQNSGNHTGQTKPHTNTGNHTGQTKPHDSDDDTRGQGVSQGGGQANGHRS